MHDNSTLTAQQPHFNFPKNVSLVYAIIERNPQITAVEISRELKMGLRTVKEHIMFLKKGVLR